MRLPEGYTGNVMVTKRSDANPASTRRRNGAAAKRTRAPKTPSIPKRRKGEDIFVWLGRVGDAMPENERAKLPTDGAANHDHYIYGSPKRY